MSEKKIRVTYEVEPPTYEQVVAYLLSQGWKKTYSTTPEWEAEHGVLLNVWKKGEHNFEIRIQPNGFVSNGTEEQQVLEAIQRLATLDNVPEYDIWLAIVLLERPKIEIE